MPALLGQRSFDSVSARAGTALRVPEFIVYNTSQVCRMSMVGIVVRMERIERIERIVGSGHLQLGQHPYRALRSLSKWKWYHL